MCLRSLDFALCLPDSGVSPEIYEGVHAGVPQGHQEKHGVDVSKNVTKNIIFLFISYLCLSFTRASSSKYPENDKNNAA